MTIDKGKLKALAQAANAVTTDVNITMAVGSAPEEVKAVQDFLQQAMPKTILALLAEIEQLKAENEALRGVMAAVIAEIPHAKHVQPGNSPGHSHRVPGIWDEDNGPKAGNECGWCKVWNTAVAMAKEANHG